jgi:chitin disaccharide deacetylase
VKRLIVNADDFGLTERVNRGILDAYRDGIVTSTTLLANGMAFESAVAAGKQFHRLGIGVHLNLSEAESVAGAAAVPTLVDASGRLHMTPARLWAAIAAGRASLREIEIELSAQVIKIVRAGITPTHFDGHKHVHVLPRVSDIVIRLAQEFHVPCVRCPLENSANAEGTRRNGAFPRISRLKQNLVGRVVSSLAEVFSAKLERAGIHFPSHFHGIRETGFLDAAAVREILDNLPDGVNELMCHPGCCDSDLVETGTRLLAQREIEIQALRSGSVRNRIVYDDIQLLNYKEMAESAQGTCTAA